MQSPPQPRARAVPAESARSVRIAEPISSADTRVGPSRAPNLHTEAVQGTPGPGHRVRLSALQLAMRTARPGARAMQAQGNVRRRESERPSPSRLQEYSRSFRSTIGAGPVNFF